ncbi:hypothetical protein NEPAR06_1241 [Nematocida parisii]|uniref:Mechanosensitive ion channel MscS domain-containing protein n=1 Tax=Nematocida parisii (strain ERTm3) TaxID=935791 RepID=I3EK79_NEMP3|nr:uncharacterized protein NEPG_00839 [Nematocida parisii ERTm1]EIJ89626.1 hypothetical protein NEQG_00396 [Nematocida parisii ERTm3]KAI5128652.1 hypothetical protein NEPAR08_1363 [Nematocida parisii]EIJ94172.1 hypothetical protein NEPG_00839 [Nematocida parisii ERTm1]KAI5128924.1 hypothetical protein NEPAR03_1415 [Nematocida parisii]KAI5141522.1 hypothetical protein NEPAR04_1023 [Nematocida parisii]|eukprot:XP_013058668.1 hypothetical protein NEPG_00839 [Nematocida parisii ERTm1]
MRLKENVFFIVLLGVFALANWGIGLMLMNTESRRETVLLVHLISAITLFGVFPLLYRRCKYSIPCFVFYKIRLQLFLLGVITEWPWVEYSLHGMHIVVLTDTAVRALLMVLYATAKRNLLKDFSTGHNMEVLHLEKYLLYATGKITQEELRKNLKIDTFYKKGRPEELPLLDIFKKWRRTDETEGSVLEEYGYGLGESLRIPNRPRLTPQMDEVEGAISVASLLDVFSPEDANVLFSLISYGERSRIQYSTFKETFRQISLERTNLYMAIKDCRRLLSHFNWFLCIVEGILVFIVFTISMNMQNLFLQTLFSFSLINAIIPGSISFFESFIFLLISHPYDTGDRVLIKGENMIVNKVGLFSTCFTTWAGVYTIIQNSVVSKFPVVNVRRSISQYWTIDLPINIECSNESILKLKKRLQWYVAEEKMLSGLVFAPMSLDNGNAVHIRLLVRKNSNFQNGFFTLTNFTKCLACIIRIVTEEGLYYKPPIARKKVTDEFLTTLLEGNSDLAKKIK